MFFRMVYKSGQISLPFCHNPRVWRTDGQTDGQTEISSPYRGCITCSAVKMNIEAADRIRFAIPISKRYIDIFYNRSIKRGTPKAGEGGTFSFRTLKIIRIVLTYNYFSIP